MDYGYGSPQERADGCGIGDREFSDHARELREHRQEGCGAPPDLRRNRIRATAMQLASAANEERPSRLLHPYVTKATGQELAEALAMLAPHTQARALWLLGNLVATADTLRETLHDAGLYMRAEDELQAAEAGV